MAITKTPRSRRPVSARQLAANRANAALSTGPRTPEGKARSSRNARRHGFAASDFAVVRLEDLEAVARLKDDLVAVYQPVNSQELFAIERVALAQHALLRCARLESGLFTTCLNEALDRSGNPIVPMTEDLVGDLEITRAQNRNYALAEGFRRIARDGNTWTLFLRYQAQTERLYRRAIEEFERLKALRLELPDEDLPNEPDFARQPEENPTPSEPPETNPAGPGAAVSPRPPAAPTARRPATGRQSPDGAPPADPRDPVAVPLDALRQSESAAANLPTPAAGTRPANPASPSTLALVTAPGCRNPLTGPETGSRNPRTLRLIKPCRALTRGPCPGHSARPEGARFDTMQETACRPFS